MVNIETFGGRIMKQKRLNVIVFIILIISFVISCSSVSTQQENEDTTPQPPGFTTEPNQTENKEATTQSPELIIELTYADVEFFPYEMGNGERIAEPPGITIELISEVAKDLGLNIKFSRFPNKRVLENLKDGSIDGAFSFSFKEDRLDSGQYPMKDGQPDNNRRITTFSYYIYKLKDSPLDWDGNQFINLDGAIGGNAGYSIVDDLRKQGIEVEEAKSTEQNLMKLQLGRIAGYAAQDITTDYLVETGQYGEIVKIPIPLVTKDYFLMFSHQFIEQHPDIAAQLWTKVGELRDSVTKEVSPKYQSSAE